MRSDLNKEMVQAKLRFFLISSISLYILILTLIPGDVFMHRDSGMVRDTILGLFSVSLALSIFFVVWLKKWPQKYPFQRRALSSLLDMVGVTTVMYIGDEWGGAIYPVYIWITFGNAFRFGLRHMTISAVLSIIGFSIVIITTPFWIKHVSISVGLLLGLFILPGYIGVLLSQKNKAIAVKSQFLANVSHELRTPLNSIISLSELAATCDDKSRSDIYMTKINTSGKHLLCVINDILDISLFDSNQITMSCDHIDIYQLAKEVKAICPPHVDNRCVRVVFEVCEGLPRNMVVDELKLKQVLINLLVNSLKFTQQGEIRLTIQVVKTDSASVRLRFSVIDTGVGIDDDSIKRIFDGFTQADNSITRKYGGTGLGLAISKKLVEKMGGKLCVKSTPGFGSTFWFEITLAISSGDTHTIPASVEMAPAPLERKVRILIAEDDPANRFVYEELLSRAGYSTELVENGKQALAMLNENKYDLAIVDHNMPDMSGLELATKIRNSEAGRLLPIISITADATETCRSNYQGLSNMHITKPFNPIDFLDAVNRALQQDVAAAGPATSSH